jgi:hypothetical protein
MSATKETEWERRTRRARMRAEHGEVCDVCGQSLGELGLCGMKRQRPLDEDHDHKTHAHRGFICWRSNRALPTYATPAWLRALADYLEART